MGKGAFPWPGFAVLLGAESLQLLPSHADVPAPGGSQVQLLWCDCHFTLQSWLPRWNLSVEERKESPGAPAAAEGMCTAPSSSLTSLQDRGMDVGSS